MSEEPQLAQLTRWYQQYAPLLHARARRIVGTGAEADDVVQEVFMRLLKDQPEEARLLPWMYTTSTHLSIDRLRHRRRRDPAWQAEVAYDLGHSADGGLDELLASRELCQRLLLQADHKAGAVAALVYLDEMTQEQAAQVLGVSRKTVIERLKRFTELARRSIARWQK